MAECPACERTLRTPTSCACGWAAQPLAPVMGVSPEPSKCATCALIFEKRKEYRPHDTSWPLNHCFVCGTHDGSVATFPDDTPFASDGGVRMCSGCRTPALRRRSTCPHEWAKGRSNGEKCEDCEQEITGHRELFREYMRLIAARTGHDGEGYAGGDSHMKPWPTILERRGVHAPRPGVDLTIPEKLGWNR